MTTLFELRMEDTTASSATPARSGFDVAIVFVCAALMTLGVVMVYSASVSVQGAELELRNWWETPLRQCVFALAGFGAMLVGAWWDYRALAWRRPSDGWRAGIVVGLALLCLAAMITPGVGTARLGAQRSLQVFSGSLPLGFQPAELAKLALVIWLAAVLSRPGHDPQSLRRGFLPAVAVAGALIVLTGIEDFGTAALLGAVLVLLLILSRARWWHIGILVLLGVVAAAVLIWMRPYRWDRIIAFLTGQPSEGVDDYQIRQSLIAIGSGGWFGRGLGAGVQKYGYLPQDNNDFLLAIVCEELGIAGGIAIVILFLALLWRGWRIASRAEDRFGQYLAAGFTIMICLQAAFNIAVVTNSVPTKGISLPFVSAGGSGVLFLGAAAGLLASVGRSARRES